jgi:sialate O-acetylesterase
MRKTSLLAGLRLVPRRWLSRWRTGLCVALAGTGHLAHANVKLPALMADNMVLQQQSNVALWGTADAGEAVTITVGWQKKPLKTTADAQGRWLVRVPTGKAGGGPYTITIQGNNKLVINNVLLGEVWLCSGQSNMNFPVARKTGWRTGIPNAAEVIPQAQYPAIRMFTVAQKVADTPQQDTEGSWVVCSPATVGDFSAVAYFFAQEIQQQTHFPIGLIHSSWGGTPAESWTRQDVLAQDPVLQPTLAHYQEGMKTYTEDQAAYKIKQEAYKAELAANPKTTLVAPVGPLAANSNKSPYKLYNGMIRPLIPYTLKGVIWYQGENNADRAAQYRRLFPALINSWRAEWQEPAMPFYFVQIAPHRSQNAEIRDAQLYTLRTVPRTGMAVITDWGDSADIHPRNKQVVGHRLALWALSHDYGQQKMAYSGPVYQDFKVENGQAHLRFEHTEGGLVAQSGPLREFTIAGADSVFRPAQARIEGRTLVVWSDAVKQPVAVRFAWKDIPHPNFFNGAGLPATPFRTDNWRLKTQGKY